MKTNAGSPERTKPIHLKQMLDSVSARLPNHLKCLAVVVSVLLLLVVSVLCCVVVGWRWVGAAVDIGLVAAVLSPVVLGFIACKPVPTRQHPEAKGGSYGGIPIGERDYIEGKVATEEKTVPYSCSFVEFDARGDYLDSAQNENSWIKAQELAAGGKLLLVMYCHGWKNNSHSEDVVRFTHFLRQLAIARPEYRVHGIYLGWCGNVYKPYVDTTSTFFTETKADFGGPVVDLERTRKQWPVLRRVGECLSSFFELLTYWGRKQAAEHKVSGVPMARTIFSAAMASRRVAELKKWDVKTFLIGHSFGALMLERCFGQASVSAVSADLSWFSPLHPTPVDPLPVDLVLFVNSAAPSIYAKELKEFLHQHYAAMNGNPAVKSRTVRMEAPIIVSVTSLGDWATGLAHPIANWRDCCRRTSQRVYKFKSMSKEPPQYYYYELTPGHNPLLVDHWADVSDGAIDNALATGDMQLQGSADAPKKVVIQSILKDRPFAVRPAPRSFVVQTVPTALDTWSEYGGVNVPWPLLHESSYWIVRCSRNIIEDHCDVWSTTAMHFYTALYHHVMELRGPTAIQTKQGAP